MCAGTKSRSAASQIWAGIIKNVYKRATDDFLGPAFDMFVHTIMVELVQLWLCV